MNGVIIFGSIMIPSCDLNSASTIPKGLNGNSPECNSGKEKQGKCLTTPKGLNVKMLFNPFGVVNDLIFSSPNCIRSYSRLIPSGF